MTNDKLKQDRLFEIAVKYLENYRRIVGITMIERVLKEYVDAETVLETPFSLFQEKDSENLFKWINISHILTPHQKVEAIAGLLIFLSGSFPDNRKMGYLEKLFGSPFVKAIEQKRKEIKHT